MPRYRALSRSGPRVVVVGGGVIGVSCAYELARAGAEVVLLERNRIGAGASWGNAGTIAAGHPPLNRPGRVAQGIRQMMDSASPLYIRPGWNPALWRWLLEFATHCTASHVRAAMEILGPLGRDALAAFDEVIAEEALDCGYRRDGYYDVCLTERGLDRARHEGDMIRAYGYEPEVLDGDELRRREPSLASDTVGGVFYPEAATLDPLAFLTALAEGARRHRAVIRERTPVEGVETDGGRVSGVRLLGGAVEPADAVVMATGPFSLRMTERLGLRLPIQAGKGHHRDVAVGPGAAPPLRIACVLNESSVFCTPMKGRVRFAGTMEFSGINDIVRPERLEQLTRSARLAFPDLRGDAPISEWSGLRPMSSDGLPIVGGVPGVEGLAVATGHGMLGLTLGPVTGRLIAAELLRGEVDPLYRRLGPDRFV